MEKLFIFFTQGQIDTVWGLGNTLSGIFFIFKYYFTQEYIFLIFLKSILLTFLDAKLLMKLLGWNLASAQLFQFWAKVMYMSEIVFFVLKNGGSTNDTLSPILMVLNLKLPLILI